MAFVRQKVDDARIEQAERELAEAVAAERPEQAGAALPREKNEAPPPGPEVPSVIDGVDWKERYANLQRYQDKILKPKYQGEIEGLTTQIKALQKQVNEMVSRASPSNLPETAAEVERLKSENPAAYGAIMKVATEVAQSLVEEQLSGMRSDVEEIKRARAETAEQAAFVELQRRFPKIDILSLEEDTTFGAWITKKSQRLRDAIFKNKTDVEAAAEVLDLYVFEVLSKVPSKDTRKGLKPGEEYVNVKGNAPVIPQHQNVGYDFTESQIEEMDKKDPRWFERNQEAVEKAMKTGRILRDISDPVGSQRMLLSMGVM